MSLILFSLHLLFIMLSFNCLREGCVTFFRKVCLGPSCFCFSMTLGDISSWNVTSTNRNFWCINSMNFLCLLIEVLSHKIYLLFFVPNLSFALPCYEYKHQNTLIHSYDRPLMKQNLVWCFSRANKTSPRAQEASRLESNSLGYILYVRMFPLFLLWGINATRMMENSMLSIELGSNITPNYFTLAWNWFFTFAHRFLSK